MTRPHLHLLHCLILMLSFQAFGQNPIIRDQFTADPTARVFGDKLYVYPSHDILAQEGKGRPGWFCMEDYHVFSTTDLVHWKDNGMIVSQENVPWVNPKGYSMWAPDCVERNGKYYFYFPTMAKDTAAYGRGFSIGVAIAEKPEGPFKPQQKPIENVKGIDPNVLIDKDGQAYLYWSAGHIYGAKLKDNMLELASEPRILQDLPQKGLKEGPFVFERKGIYYLTYPHVANKIERLEYATSDNPLGPFTFRGVIMDESPTGCWTNHQSIVKYKNQWYLFYHHNDYSPDFDKSRSIRVDSLSFNEDGTIKKVVPTFRGVGISNASEQIQVDRYSRKDAEVSIAFNDTLNTFKGWHVIVDDAGEWIAYDGVDFVKNLKSVGVYAFSETGATLELRLDKENGALVSEISIPKQSEWQTIDAKVLKYQSGVHDLYLVLKEGSAKIDWIQFSPKNID